MTKKIKALIITNKGFEEESLEEIKEISKNITNIKIKEKKIFFETSKEELIKITFFSQTIYKTFEILSEGKTFQELTDNLLKEETNHKILNKPLKVFSLNTFSQKEIKEFADTLIEKSSKKNINIKVSMTQFKTSLYLIKEENNILLGLDYAIKNLSKRDYRIFCHQNSLNSTTAASLIYFSELNKKLNNSKKTIKILDPFCGSGTIPIEIAIKNKSESPQKYELEQLGFYKTEIINIETIKKITNNNQTKNNKIEIYGYDHMLPSVKASQKNAKIINLNKDIQFSKIGVDWLDTKFEENEIDFIITHPPTITKNNEKKIIKTYKEFFYQSKYIAKNITIISENNIKNIIEEEKEFIIKKEKSIYQGNKKLYVFLIEKNKN